MYHDAVGARELQAPGEVKCVHPAQDECKHHHSVVGLDARQVESSRDYNQYRVDEAGEDRMTVSEPALLLKSVMLQQGGGQEDAAAGIWHFNRMYTSQLMI